MNLRIWRIRLTATFLKRNESEQQLDDDIREHLALATDENIRLGMNPREAAEAARRSFGGRDQMKEAYRDQRGVPMLETIGRELRFAMRNLRRAPGFALLAILTLGLGIGATAAISSAVNGLLFHPAGVSEPNRVVIPRVKYEKLNAANLPISYNDYEDMARSREIFDSTTISKTGSYTYTGGEFPQRLQALRVGINFFEVFGAQPARGRLFTEAENEPGAGHVAILGDAAWHGLFGGDPAILGKIIELDQVPYKIVGVMRPEFAASIHELGGLGGQPQDLFVPLGFRPTADPRTRYLESFLGIARLQRGVPFEKARAFMSVLTDRGYRDSLAGRARKINGWGMWITSYTDFTGGDLKAPLLILWGAVGLVLLIASANIAGLMLARMSARSRELAVRAALGGSRWHLLGQVFAECSLLGIGGSAAGLCFAYVFIRAVESWGPHNIAGGSQIPFDATMVAFTAAAGLVAALVAGLAPAMQLRRVGSETLAESLKEGGRSGTSSRERMRLRSVMVTAEVALALVLSIGSGLLLRSLSRLRQVDTGFQTTGVMTASVTLPEARHKDAESIVRFYRGAIERLRAIPGATSAAAAYPLPFGEGLESRSFSVYGRPVGPNEPLKLARICGITPEFFASLQISMRSGRAFTEQDTREVPRVAILDEALVQQYWAGENPIGQKIVTMGGGTFEIVGVAAHTRQADLSTSQENGVLYYPLYQEPIGFATLLVRSQGAPAAASAMREAVAAVDPLQSVYDPRTMEERVTSTLAARSFAVVLLALFAAAAVFLASLGLYGVINYSVTQRTQEIGIRIALGARRGQVLMMVVGSGLRIAAAGLTLGTCAAFLFARLLPNQLFGISPFDPLTFAAMAALLALVAILASYVPARRAVRLDPVEACRHE